MVMTTTKDDVNDDKHDNGNDNGSRGTSQRLREELALLVNNTFTTLHFGTDKMV
ncbi:hypothetical protein AJ78_05522 [Emergomyces pasteurianus Ep9510]|uniref:Uncharacterized protein n=1 Tax=Emergomyces pasteurianus Ep9510 TaxID=1447872 RepID=A0A1J9QG05_9EURO|nr:hypothetical protein AJ78_05522 [Emergomyces pasteurianus Ep9510]